MKVSPLFPLVAESIGAASSDDTPWLPKKDKTHSEFSVVTKNGYVGRVLSMRNVVINF
jgi:hypothetical protein